MEYQIREIQNMLLEMLREIDAICQKNHIEYQLFAGSALGAVRHSGFIPWDDDLDIIMSRADYEHFLSAAAVELDRERYFLQCEYSEHFPMFYSKLRRNGTTYMERYIPRDKKMHQGIFVDIFPMDNLSDNDFVARLQFYASKIVIAKCLRKRGYATDSVKKKLFMAACTPLPLKPLARFVQRKKDNGSRRVHSFFGGSSRYGKSVYPRSVLQTVPMTFEDGSYPVSAKWDRLLNILYGDYMTLPPEEQRAVKRHFLKVDLHHSYEKYISWQNQQIINEFTRSIR